MSEQLTTSEDHPIQSRQPLSGSELPQSPSTHPIADGLQQLYEAHRVPETWDTPSVSRQFFDTWRNEGFVAASSYLLHREQSLGDPSKSPIQKVGALGLGIAAVVVADKIIGHKNTQPQHPETRSFGKRAAWTAALYAGGAALLMAANGPQEYSTSGGGESLIRYVDPDTGEEVPNYSYSDFSEEVESLRASSSWESMHTHGYSYELDNDQIEDFLRYETIDDAIKAARLDGMDENEFLRQMMEGTGSDSYSDLAQRYGYQDEPDW